MDKINLVESRDVQKDICQTSRTMVGGVWDSVQILIFFDIDWGVFDTGVWHNCTSSAQYMNTMFGFPVNHSLRILIVYSSHIDTQCNIDTPEWKTRLYIMNYAESIINNETNHSSTSWLNIFTLSLSLSLFLFLFLHFFILPSAPIFVSWFKCTSKRKPSQKFQTRILLKVYNTVARLYYLMSFNVE